MLWEMLTGQRLFGGDTVAHILASVLKDEPDWTAVPPKVRRLLQACLQKDPKQRQRDAKMPASLNHPNIAAIYGVAAVRW